MSEIVQVIKEVQVVESNDGAAVVQVEKQVQIIEPIEAAIYLGGDAQPWVTGETPAGAVNGSNATFTTAFSFVPESVEVFIETCRLSLLDDYNTSGTQTIQFYVSPLAGEKIRVNYQRQ
jgi:hypothetical protein